VNAHVFGRSAFQLLYLGVFFVAAMIVCIGAISLVANTYSFHLVTIWILATSLGFSDPVATEALSLNLELSQKLKALLIGESQLGVVTAFIIFKALLKIRTGENNGSDGAFWGAYAVREPLLSIGVGIVTGTVAVLILQETSDRTSSSAMMIQVSTLAVLSFGPFLIAEYFLESCGLMTTVVVGYMVASFGWPLFASRTLIKHMRILIAFVVSNIMFIQTGLVIGSSIHAAIDGASPFGATEVGYVFAIYATLLLARVLLLVLMRPTLNSVGKYDFSFSEGFVLSWSGMPGSPSMMFMLLLREEIENQLEAEWLIFVVGGVILISQVIQGLLLMPLTDYLGINGKNQVETGLETFALEKYRKITAQALNEELDKAAREGVNVDTVKLLMHGLHLTEDAGNAAGVELVDDEEGVGTIFSKEATSEPANIEDEDLLSDEGLESPAMFLRNLQYKDKREQNFASTTHLPFVLENPFKVFSRSSATLSRFEQSEESDRSERKEALLAGLRVVFLKSLRATYWEQIRAGTIPKGTTTARSMLNAAEEGLDRIHEPMNDFAELNLPAIGLHGSRFRRCVDWSLSKVELSVSLCFPALFQDLAARTVHGAVGEAAFRATCLISGHMYAREVLVNYILNESHGYEDAVKVMKAASKRIKELRYVLMVLEESQHQIDAAKNYLRSIKEFSPGVVAAVETKKIISMVLEEQRSFAKQLHNQGVLGDHHHHELVLFLREDQKKLKRMKIGPAPVDIRSSKRASFERTKDGDILLDQGENNIVEIDIDRTDFFEHVEEEEKLSRLRERRLTELVHGDSAREQEDVSDNSPDELA